MVEIKSCRAEFILGNMKMYLLFTPQPKLGSRGIVVACRAGGRALPHTVTALPGAVLIGSRSNLVGTILGAGSRTSSFMGDMAR